MTFRQSGNGQGSVREGPICSYPQLRAIEELKQAVEYDVH